MNTKRKRLSCPVCGEKIMDKSFLARHVCKCPVDLNGTLVCRECDALFDTTVQLQNHALTAHEQKLSLNVKDENQAERENFLTLTCPCWLLSFSSLVKLKNHVTEHERVVVVDGGNHVTKHERATSVDGVNHVRTQPWLLYNALIQHEILHHARVHCAFYPDL